MIYRLSVSCGEHGHQFYAFFSSRKEAKAAARLAERTAYGPKVPDWFEDEDRAFAEENRMGDATIDSAPTPRTKREMIALLNRWGDHADNG